nr:immunoglobulin light chain junction region [Macaca mulatta]MOX81964.1 immunoglobulin light chain junction region [Macaca mulatta]MOX82113.1 immunoglobulin light chain junction region [Macaca mulatta]
DYYCMIWYNNAYWIF